MKKIVLIGPVYPYRGGISHYTGLFCRALRERHQVEMISYKMQYPKLLMKKEQKDYSNDSFAVADTRYWINTANPFNCIMTAGKIKKLKPDLVIFQWWHPYFAPCYYLMELFLGKKWKKMFVCHNVFPHERFPMDKKLARLVLNKGDYFITQSDQDTKDLLGIKPSAQYRHTVHPSYDTFKMSNLSKEDARKKLGISPHEKILLFFGFVREYKGLKHILRAMPEICRRIGQNGGALAGADGKAGRDGTLAGAGGEMGRVRLLIAGEFAGDKETYTQLIADLGIEESVQIFDSYIPDEKVEPYFAAADLVVLPYESATQSGVVQIAYGFNRPVVVTNVGGLPEVVEDGKTGFVVEAGDDDALADAVVRFFEENLSETFQKNIADREYLFSWERMREVVEELVGWKEMEN